MESNERYVRYRDSELEVGADRPVHWDDNSSFTTRNVTFGNRAVQEEYSTEVLKVSTRSRPSAVAGAIAGVIRESGSAEVQSIGAGATNQAIKAVAIARSYLLEEGIDIACVPSFIDVSIEEEERTAIRLLVQRQS
jgi:stage V sporulation protein S